jgi:glycosyltransferase involved in cell wall biosynthesis
MQKIIINATNIGRNLSGIGRYSLSLSHYFLEHWDYPFQLFINNYAQIHFQGVKNIGKIKVASSLISPDLDFKGHLLRLLWTNKLCLQNQKDLVFNTSQLEGSLNHKKQVITVHDLIPLIFPQYHKKQYYYFKYVLPIILKNTIKVLSVSHHTKNLIMDLYKIPKERISVIYNGISESFLNCKVNPKKQDYILYVGRISPTKNIKGLIKAFELLTNNINSI